MPYLGSSPGHSNSPYHKKTSMTLARRAFLRFLAASPLAAQDPATARDAIRVLDFEPLALKNLPPAHWGYMSTGVEDDLTLRANRDAMTHYQLRPRRLSGAGAADLRTEIFGQTWDMPIYASAVSGQRAFHPQGELATARAAKAQKTVQLLSSYSSTSVEEVAKNLGAPPWYQLYMPIKWEETEKLIHRVEAAGCPVLAWTVDTMVGRNTETATRLARTDTRNCLSCHANHPITGPRVARNRTLPMFSDLSGENNPANADWSYVGRLKKLTRMKVIIKGLETAEDALLARENGADGIVVSNHGGRATETGRGTLDILPEIIDAVGPHFPVFIDGGFRRGSDVFKALAIGARAIGIGRPQVWGLAAFGQEGVERVLELFRAELTLTMRQCGVPNIAAITRAAILRNGARL